MELDLFLGSLFALRGSLGGRTSQKTSFSFQQTNHWSSWFLLRVQRSNVESNSRHHVQTFRFAWLTTSRREPRVEEGRPTFGLDWDSWSRTVHRARDKVRILQIEVASAVVPFPCHISRHPTHTYQTLTWLWNIQTKKYITIHFWYQVVTLFLDELGRWLKYS